MEYLQIVLLVNTMLLAVVGFFLKNIHSRFEKLETELHHVSTATALENQRIAIIEKDVAELKQMVIKQFFKIHD